MSVNDLDRRLTGYCDATSSVALPDGLLDDVFGVTRRLPQHRSRLARGRARVAAWWTAPFGTARQARVLLVAVLVLVALVVALTYVAGHWRRVPPPFGPAENGLIVFDIDQRLYIADPDGLAVPLDVGLGHSWNPSFSPDGLRLAFWSQGESGTPVGLFVADADGSHARNVTPGMSVVGEKLASISWSPDSRRLVFSSSTDTWQSRLYIAEADGSGVVPLTPDGDLYDRTSPSWSPRGDLIAFRRSLNMDAELAVIAADGSGERMLRRDAVSNGPAFQWPLWSPDGTKIATQWYPDGTERVGFVRLDGTFELMDEPGEAEAPVWSNDGTRLAYFLYPSGLVAIRDIATRARTMLPAGLGDFAVYWSPDDTQLVGIGAGGSAWRIPIDNPKAATRLTDVQGDLHMFTWQRVVGAQGHGRFGGVP